MAAANRYIDSALLGMDTWITKGNWQNGFGEMFIQFRNSMQIYYLRVSGQSIRQAQVQKTITPLRTAKKCIEFVFKRATQG
jgi:hypothetical protein